jgi:hypothetical protein
VKIVFLEYVHNIIMIRVCHKSKYPLFSPIIWRKYFKIIALTPVFKTVEIGMAGKGPERWKSVFRTQCWNHRNLFFIILWPMPLFLLSTHTQTMHIKSFYRQQHCYVSLKTLYPSRIRTRVFSFLRRMRCPLCRAARAP